MRVLRNLQTKNRQNTLKSTYLGIVHVYFYINIGKVINNENKKEQTKTIVKVLHVFIIIKSIERERGLNYLCEDQKIVNHTHTWTHTCVHI